MNAIVAGGDGFSALLFAAHSCNPHLVNAFVEEDTLGQEWMGDYCGGTVVTSAAQSGSIDVLEIFLDEENQKSHEYNINQVVCPPINMLPQFAREDIKALLTCVPEIHSLLIHSQRLDGGETALFLAAQEGSVAVVQALLSYGADPNLEREDGCTPLIIASEMGHEQVVEALLHPDNGYQVDISACCHDLDAASVAASERIVELIHNYAMDSQVRDCLFVLLPVADVQFNERASMADNFRLGGVSAVVVGTNPSEQRHDVPQRHGRPHPSCDACSFYPICYVCVPGGEGGAAAKVDLN